MNESTAYRIIRKIEDILTKSKTFTLPGKKKLVTSNYQLEVVVVDLTENPIERPKKNLVGFEYQNGSGRSQMLTTPPCGVPCSGNSGFTPALRHRNIPSFKPLGAMSSSIIAEWLILSKVGS